MPQFISKLQHNTYEKGEFSDEQPRDLEETINLVKDFPWDAERTLTDIQLTGPSITIQDDDFNYLKLGLYFGGKFCVYYLDRDNHLYEYHAPDLDAARNLVSDFFVQELNLQLFKKHFFNIGNRAHFLTKNFIYKLKAWRVILLTFILFVYTLLFLLTFYNNNFNNALSFVPGVVITIPGLFIVLALLQYLKNGSLYLQISKGNNQFSFGLDKEQIITYNKSDIAEIICQGSRGDNNRNIFGNVVISFKDGSNIKIPNLIISSAHLREKFKDQSDNYIVPVIFKSGNIFK